MKKSGKKVLIIQKEAVNGSGMQQNHSPYLRIIILWGVAFRNASAPRMQTPARKKYRFLQSLLHSPIDKDPRVFWALLPAAIQLQFP